MAGPPPLRAVARPFLFLAGEPAMTQADLNQAVAKATGESTRTIERLGFVPLTFPPYEREPLVTDWDTLDRPRRVAVFPSRRGRRSVA
jgi:hypothetical protein